MEYNVAQKLIASHLLTADTSSTLDDDRQTELVNKRLYTLRCVVFKDMCVRDSHAVLLNKGSKEVLTAIEWTATRFDYRLHQGQPVRILIPDTKESFL